MSSEELIPYMWGVFSGCCGTVIVFLGALIYQLKRDRGGRG